MYSSSDNAVHQFEDHHHVAHLAYDPHSSSHNINNADNTFGDITLQLNNMNDYGGLSASDLFNDDNDEDDDENDNSLLRTIKRTIASNNNNFISNSDYSNAQLYLNQNSNNNENIDGTTVNSILGNTLLGSPQPSTVKKLKSHLSGIGGIGGYLTSPMTSFNKARNNNNNNNNDSPSGSIATNNSIFSVLKPSNMRSSNLIPSSPLKPLSSNGGASQQSSNNNGDAGDNHCFDINALPPMPLPMSQGQQSQQAHQYQYNNQANNNASTSYALDPSLAAPSMMRYRSAPATSTTQGSTSASTSTSTSTSSKTSRSKKNSKNTTDNNLNVPQNGGSNAPSPTASSFNEMDYGGMRIYGRPIQRSLSEDPSSSSSYANNNNGQDANTANSQDSNGNSSKTGSGFLPYPDQLPTITLGRGVKNARDLSNPMTHSTFPVISSKSEPGVTSTSSNAATNANTNAAGGTAMKKQFTNLDKPFIQYVAPNSPAGKAIRNKKSLTVHTSSSSAQSNNENNNGKMIPIKMPNHHSHHRAVEMPLTPPISAGYSAGILSPASHHSQHSQNNDNGYQSSSNVQYATSQQMRSANSQASSSASSIYQDSSNNNMLQYQQQQQDNTHQNGNGNSNTNRPFFSPVKNTFDFNNEPQGLMNGSNNMPSFEFSLEQFGGGGQSSLGDQNGADQYSANNMNIGTGKDGNGAYNNGNPIDFSSVLGLPSPHHHQLSSASNYSNDGSNHGSLLSPTQPPLSAASSHSSVFSDDQALLFGIPPPASPYFSPSSASGMGMADQSQQQSIDQALASLLGGGSTSNNNNAMQIGQQINRDGARTPQQQQSQSQTLGLGMQNTFSPNHQHQQQQTFQQQTQAMFSPHHQQMNQMGGGNGQFGIGISSPPLSPLNNGSQMTSPAHQGGAWAPYQQQSNLQQNLLPNIDPALQGLSPMRNGNGQHELNQQNLNMLSPQSAHFGMMNNGINNDNMGGNGSNGAYLGNGRPISSPRRLRGMQSAPDLNALYSDNNSNNGFNDAFGITTSPSPRKPSLKRGRGGGYNNNGDSDAENRGGGQHYQYGDDISSDIEDDDDEEDDYYQPGDRPPPRKRANSIHSTATSAGGGKMDHHNQYQSLQPGNGNTAVAAVLLPLVNPNPSRLRPGPKPKTSLPNLQAAHQGVFQVSPRAPPVPSFPSQYLGQQAASPNPSNAGSTTASTAACLSPDPDTGYLKPQGGVSKDMLATFYSIGTGSKQTKKGKPQRMYVCSIPGCEKEFPRKSAVESHIQTHLEDKPFACPYDECGASFVRSHDLTRHVRIHSGSKPFQCICGKGFARGDALTRHRQRGICEGSLVPRRW